MGCANKATFESQRGYVCLAFVGTRPCTLPDRVITDLVKQIGRQLLAGKLNLINVSLPVKIFEARSYLEKLADVWVYPQYVVSVGLHGVGVHDVGVHAWQWCCPQISQGGCRGDRPH